MTRLSAICAEFDDAVKHTLATGWKELSEQVNGLSKHKVFEKDGVRAAILDGSETTRKCSPQTHQAAIKAKIDWLYNTY